MESIEPMTEERAKGKRYLATAKLHSVLASALLSGRKLGQNALAYAVWEDALEAEKFGSPVHGSTRKFFAAYGELLALIDAAHDEVLEARGGDAIFFRWVDHVRFATDSANLSMSWTQIANGLEGEPMLALEFASRVVGGSEVEYELDPDVLSSLIGQVESLETAVRSSDLDPRFAALVLARLDEIRAALAAADLRGVGPVIDALERTYGSFGTRHNIYLAESKHGVWEAFLELLNNLRASTAACNEVLQLPQNAAALFDRFTSG